MNINVLYESVTNSIIKEMEAGAVPWVKPWKTSRNHGSVMPHNRATGRPYSGINIPLLWGAADANGYRRIRNSSIFRLQRPRLMDWRWRRRFGEDIHRD